MKVFTSPFADWPWISQLCGQPMACLWTHMSSGCLCMLFLWSGTLRGSTVFLVIWSLDVSYCRKYVTKHHFGLRWIFHFCFIVHSLGLQLAGTGLPGLKDTLFFLLGDLLILDERFYHVFSGRVSCHDQCKYSDYGFPEDLLCLKFKIFPSCALLFSL